MARSRISFASASCPGHRGGDVAARVAGTAPSSRRLRGGTDRPRSAGSMWMSRSGSLAVDRLARQIGDIAVVQSSYATLHQLRGPYPRLVMTRTYEIRTYGCQMNVHDSERLAGLLEDAGYERAGRRRRRPRRVQHLRRARERRQPAVRQPRPPLPGQGGQPGHADRRRRVPGAEGPRPHRREGAVGRRRVRHAQPGRAAGAARARPAQQARPQVEIVEALQNFPSDLPTPARVAVQRLGVGLGRLRQHLHVLHRPVACAARRPTAGPATCSPRSARWSTPASSR